MISQATRPFAGVVGSKASIPVNLSGTMFYLTAASGPLFIRPAGGVYSLYYSGQGTNVSAGFSLLEIYNPTANGVTFQLVAGTDDFIDKRQIPSTQTPTIVKPSGFGGPGSGFLPDVSGLGFTDSAGNSWLAISRVAIIMQIQSGANFTISLSTANNAGFPVALIASMSAQFVGSGGAGSGETVQPVISPMIFSAAGNFSVFSSVANGSTSSGYINSFSVIELYQAIAPNAVAYQPPN